jgi:hypothetical protein
LGLAFNVHSQVSDSIPLREDIAGDIMIDIYRTKVNSAIEKVNDFTSNWDSGGLTATQKISIENIYSHYKDRSLPPNPYLINFIHMITLAGSNELIQLNIMDEILEVTSKVIENESRNRIHKYYRNINTFLKYGAIHYSNGYKLMVENFDISFDYVESSEMRLQMIGLVKILQMIIGLMIGVQMMIGIHPVIHCPNQWMIHCLILEKTIGEQK